MTGSVVLSPPPARSLGRASRHAPRPVIAAAAVAAVVLIGGGVLQLMGSGDTPTPAPDAAPADTTCPDQVNTWIGQAVAVMEADGSTGGDFTDAKAICIIIAHESAGNPDAENKSDKNWLQGHPSRGLMQTIPSVFATYCLPGHCGDIYNPVDNIIAGVRYAIQDPGHNYGSLANTPGVKSVRAGGPYKPY